MYSLRFVQLHSNVIIEDAPLLDCICVKQLYLNRYGIDTAIFDEDGYLVSSVEINHALEEVYRQHCKVHPLSGIV